MSPQQTIAHYRIGSKLGEGGMGAVYRATDTKLGRDVAIKVIPESFAQDHDRMARFRREAQVLASLNHPNIAAIYGVEENAIVMELVEGETLRGPMPLSEALPLIQQLIDALEYAHDKGVVHRDLKPANVMITRDGVAKVLDFGLARVAQASTSETEDLENSPTRTIAGMIMGTAGYMAPEQARGQTVDRRADIWAFGVVVYEMLTGRRLFEGATISDTLAAVLTKEPELGVVPARVRRLLRLCLVKDPRRRLSHISGARILLEERPATSARGRSVMPWAIAAAFIALSTVFGVIAWKATQPVEHPLVRLNADLGTDALVDANTTIAISPDGKRIVFPARGPDGKQQLATRLLDQAQATLLPGTQDAADPFFSPNGQSVGFFADAKLRKISVQGGAPVTLCDAPYNLGATWGEDDNIIAALSSTAGLSRVSAEGGAPHPLIKLGNGETTHRWPQILPGGQAIVFTASPTSFGFDDAHIVAVSLKTGERKTVQRGGYFGRYLPSGHLVYVHQGVLYGAAFDPARLELRSAPAPLLDDVVSNATTGRGQLDFSGAGTLVYLAGKAVAQVWPVVWLDRFGKTQPLVSTAASYSFPRFSPDGRRLGLAVVSDKGSDLIAYDWQRDTMMRLTFGAQARAPVWTPDGKHIVFESYPVGGYTISWIRSDGAGAAEPLLRRNNPVVPYSFSPDGRRLAYHERNPETGTDIWTLPLDISDPEHPKPGKPEPFLRTPADERVPTFSPDGRWIAYRSDESGRLEIYVRPFPVGGGKWQISTDGGLYAFWSKSGRELFYESLDNRIVVVDYTASGDSFVPGKPRVWSDQRLYFPGNPNLDLAPDGKRFAVFPMLEGPSGEKSSVHVTFLLNFFDELKRRLPAGNR